MEFLANRLVEYVPNVAVLRVGTGARQSRAVTEQLAAIPDS